MMTRDWRMRVFTVAGAMWWICSPQFSASLAAEPPSLGKSTGNSAALELQGESGDRGAVVFKTVCATCHESPGTRAPSPTMLSGMSPNTIVLALKSGDMRNQGQGISDLDKILVAEYLTKNKAAGGADRLSPPTCKGEEGKFA